MGNKGFSYERSICKQLSLWWTAGERDDIFWRTPGSGARATTRAKQNKDTFGQHGDIQAIDPIGLPFTNLLFIEIKRGYPNATASNIIDAPSNAKQSQLETFVSKAIHSSTLANAYSWMIIHKRDRREPTIIIPSSLTEEFMFYKKIFELKMYLSMRYQTKNNTSCRINQILFSDFLLAVTPAQIKQIYRNWRTC